MAQMFWFFARSDLVDFFLNQYRNHRSAPQGKRSQQNNGQRDKGTEQQNRHEDAAFDKEIQRIFEQG
jgi:hypothetical protein